MKIVCEGIECKHNTGAPGDFTGECTLPEIYIGDGDTCMCCDSADFPPYRGIVDSRQHDTAVKIIPIASGEKNVQALKYTGIKPHVNESVYVNECGEMIRARDEYIHRIVGHRGSDKEFGALPDDQIWVVIQI